MPSLGLPVGLSLTQARAAFPSCDVISAAAWCWEGHAASLPLTSLVQHTESICLSGKLWHFLLIIWVLLASQGSDS